LVPKKTPNIICTTFAANALLDMHGWSGEKRFLEAAESAAAFVAEVLYTREGADAWFNYTPLERTQVHNANVLGAALLCRVAQYRPEQNFSELGLQAARFSVARQNSDGSWYYGERKTPSQEWIDNFHTGFTLCALADIAQFTGTHEFATSFTRGLDYYVSHFFEADGAPKYFHDRGHPYDVHSAAQSILTLRRLKDAHPDARAISNKVLDWTLRTLWDERGYFHYQQHRYWRNRIPYLRWGQAWMLLALATVIEDDAAVSGTAADDARSSACVRGNGSI
jgi:hypothetical protein